MGYEDLKIIYISFFSKIRSNHGGGGHKISIIFQIQNSLHCSRGGGGQDTYGLFPQLCGIFSFECFPALDSSTQYGMDINLICN